MRCFDSPDNLLAARCAKKFPGCLAELPLLVPGELENFKVTWPQDLALAERLLATRGARP